ncbi:TetR/AcrR family transcriptional regulator [Paenibacillus sp. MMS20-IR301]|uniref:TetR/AcrR family transcriptional regulator n=1 Tax=Paenibacillus sp. MMS20-IR301 TaxID=2895946 RepID=UPI0028ED8345|nr:TetR/AcrR family transcriptional regulator [Paenibacillus sp. MMS20-IR301]WNS44726.1 TetR/AcrR family transcriptional regulator [Paenibacillus sp. MMS20-IR301]
MQNSSGIPSADKHQVTTYAKVKLQHNELLRRNIIESAASIMLKSGPEAVTIRRVAEIMECPTKVIYNLFGSKEGLAKELFLEGCKLLADAFQAVPLQADLKQYFLDLGQAYWDFSKDYSSYYMVMFGGAFSEFKPEEESLQAMVTALQQLTNMISTAIEQGYIAEKDPFIVVNLVWASLHGVIHLYSGGHIQNEATAKMLYDRSLLNLIHTFYGSGR